MSDNKLEQILTTWVVKDGDDIVVAREELEKALTQLIKDSERKAVYAELSLLPAWNNCKCDCATCKVIAGRLEELRESDG